MTYTKYVDPKGEWRWRLRAANGETIASGEGYTREESCNHAIRLFKAAAASAPVRRLDNRSPTGWVPDPAFSTGNALQNR